MKGYIYLITNLVNNKQYVGQTVKTIQERFRSHIYEAKNEETNMLIHKSIRKYGIENFEVSEIKCVDADDRKDLVDKLNYYEILYIAEYNTLTPNGYNMTKGGNEFREYSKIKVDEYDLYGNFIQTYDSYDEAGKNIGPHADCSIRKCCLGQSQFAFQRVWRLHGDPFDKYELPDIEVAQREYKLAAVDQYSMSGELLNTFPSVVSAGQFMGVDNSSHISECCKGKIPQIYGFVWRYHGEPFGSVVDKRSVSVSKYSKNGEFIQTYKSLKDACMEIGNNIETIGSNIRCCIQGKRKSAYGFVWKYAS